jgi:hypothetical protein
VLSVKVLVKMSVVPDRRVTIGALQDTRMRVVVALHVD